MQSIRLISGPATRIRKWNQLNEFRLTSTKVIPTEKMYIPVSVIYPIYPSGNWEHQPRPRITSKRLYGRFIYNRKCTNDRKDVGVG